ncbi:pentatricopeptide repeat-containing protein At1g08070, chloroplastic-like [Phoenix dactylifera]|uniref:Pentatricopeptide repeat-containing protein At1g08070, chloroplastic-like n=1 Tax=Phoenix dactylifera TaxID=42345 RepID=A0A8B7BL16_PHODC|nr:pentatricopeptide repeat-containing protein At1g08070, chloroplastic-like [Phoenix dactylifera]
MNHSFSPSATQTQPRPPLSINHAHLAALLQLCQTPRELNQIHAASIKTGLFPHSPAFSSRLLALHSRPVLATLDEARSVLARIPHPTAFSWNALIKRCVEEHHSHTALALFSDMLRRSSAAPDNFTLPCVIKGCARLNAVQEGKQIHGLILKLGFGPDGFVQSSLVSFYCKCGDLVSAREVFDRISCRDLVTWNSMVDGYARNGQIEVARGLFDEMPERDLFSWASLINGYSKCGETTIAREIFEQMPEKNVVSCNAMIDGYMKNGDFESARELFDRMPMKNVITWNTMITGFDKNGRFKEALSVYERVLAAGLVPNMVTLVSVLSAVSGLALLERGRSVHSYIRQNGFRVDGVLGTCLIDMYSKCGSIESALSVFEEIHRRKLGHWTAMIMGLGMHGMANDAIQLFMEMQRVGIRPHSIAFVGVLSACSHAGMVDEGRQYFDLMSKEYGIKPTVEHYGSLVDLLCRVGRLKEARDVIDQMPMRPNEIIWMNLLSGCRKYGKVELGEFAAKRAIELAPEASGCYVLLSNIYASAGLWDSVSKMRGLMKERGVRKDPGSSMVEHGGVVHEFAVGDTSHPQTEAIYNKLNEMGKRLKCAGYIPDTSQVLLCIEERDKEAELALHSERLAIAFGLINAEQGSPIRVVKNLRVCNDCHNVTKLLSGFYEREIIVRDNSRFHHFKKGTCSCMDYW